MKTHQTPREQREILFAIEEQDSPSPYFLITNPAALAAARAELAETQREIERLKAKLERSTGGEK